ncbi:MAG: hypothetical protein PHR61_02200 [Candidatus Absconditabacteria bacterium]|nr:hypothetical protein [Candidatus Absconditabacteria bacterium]
MKYINKILKSEKTIFNYKDIGLLLGIENRETIKSFLSRQIKSGTLQRLSKGIYALPNFDKYEFASKIKKNSYISFETVLKSKGIIFQDYSHTIFLASDNTGEKKVIGLNFVYNKIKKTILQNPLGLEQKKQYTIASTERAICDRIYISGDYYFDNLEGINIQKLKQIAQIYNKRVILQIDKLIKNAQHRST